MPTNRRDFLRAVSVALAAIPVALPRLGHAQVNAPIQLHEKTTADVGIRAFSINTPEEALADLRTRLAAMRLPDKELVADPSQGVQLSTIQALARYWATDYDLRRVETRLNALPQFVTEIEGLDIHFIHVRSPHENALPLIITHGWPGSIIEMLEVVDPLTNPTAHGGSAEDAFHVVIPSMPGYGFSGKPTTTGWGAGRVAQAWAELMDRLGYTGYVAQGGDQGALVTHAMAVQAPAGLLGIHLNLPAAFPPEATAAIFAGGQMPAGMSEQEQAAIAAFAAVIRRGYLVEQNEHPQTIGYSLTDTPVGLAAWMLDHDPDSYAKISRAFIDGQPTGGLTRERIVDNITLYWLTSSATSAARLYWEGARGAAAAAAAGQTPPRVLLPAAYTVFPGEIVQAPRSWLEEVYPNLIYFNAVDKGGHFAAWEEPELFSSELRQAFRSLR